MKRFKARLTYLLLIFILSVSFMTGCGGGGAETGHWLPSRVVSIAVTPATASIPMGAPQQFVAVATYTDGTSLDVTASSIWASGTTAVATVNSASGLAAGVAIGASVITADFDGKSGSATLTVTAATLVSIAVTPLTASIPSGLTQRFVATGTYTDGTTRDISNIATWSSGAIAVATVASPGVATGQSIGAALITATSGGKSGSATLTVTAATLVSIAVTPATASVPMGLTQRFIATGTFTDGTTLDISNTVTWSSGALAVATIVSPGVATGRSIGTATITATSGIRSGSATLTVTAATLSSIAVTPLTASVPMGLTQRFVATGAYSDGTSVDISSSVTWSSGAIAVATVVSPGIATGRSVGTATITAALSGRSGSATLTVTAATLSSIAVTPLAASVPMGLTQPFVARGTYSDGTTLDISSSVTWSSGNIVVATVVSPGVATGVSVGTATITATSGIRSGSATLTVTAATLSSIAVTPLTASVPMGLTQRFVATGAYSDGTSVDISSSVTWSSGAIAVATVVSPGIATGVSVGTAAITATSGIRSGSATLTVTAATLSSIAVTPLTASVPMGLTQRFVATGAYSDGTSVDISSSVTWSSGAIAVATVVSPGIATGRSIGTAAITATSGIRSGSATLTVTAATLSSIAVTPLTASVPVSVTQRFIATGAYSDGTSVDISNLVTWSSNNLTVATVVSPGVATGLTAGTAAITATSGIRSGSATLTVTAATLSSIAVTPAAATVAIGGTQTFVANGTYSDGSVVNISNLVTWSSNNLPVATVVSPGVATGLTAGAATITASSGIRSGTAALTVTAATLNSIAVTPLTATVAIGGTQTFVATGTYSDGSVVNISNLVTWSSNNLPVATVVSPGVATGLSGGAATITATSGIQSGTAALTVTAATLNSIAVTPLTATIAIGGTQTFVATGTYSDGSVVNISNLVAWTSNNLPVATVVSPGVATGLTAGLATITATSGTTSGTAALTVAAPLGPPPVLLGLAGNFAALTKAGITDVPPSPIIGSIGASPISGAAIGVTCAEVTGTIYSVDAAGPAPCSVVDPVMLTTAVSNMETAYTDAAGRPAGVGPNLNLGAGTVAGQTLVPGTYTWGSNVTITTDLTLNGGPNDVWLFQITGTLDLSPNMNVVLTGGALPKNIFWQVAGAVTLFTGSHFEGNILAQTNIAVQTGASMNGRLLAQTGVSLQQNAITIPAP